VLDNARVRPSTLLALPVAAALAAAPQLAQAQGALERCAGADADLAFAGNDFVELSGDTGWFPSGFVAQLRLTARVAGHTNVTTGYRATACWEDKMQAGLAGNDGAGMLDVAYGAELALYGRIHTTVLGYDINWEGQIPIPWIPEDLLIAGAGTFTPRLDTGGVYVSDNTDPVTVLSTDVISQVISLGGISGGLYVSVQGDMTSTYRAKKVSFAGGTVDAVADLISIAQPTGGFHSTLSLPVSIDGSVKYQPRLTFAAGLDVKIFGIRVVDWQLASVPMTLPPMERAIKLTGAPATVLLPELDGIGDGARMDFESASTQFLHIKNTGEGKLQLAPVDVPPGVQIAAVTLEGKDEADLRVSVDDTALASGSKTLKFATNDPDRPEVSIELGMNVGGTDPGTPPEIAPEEGGCSAGSDHSAGMLFLVLALAFTTRRRK
jgi:MYXO-CTERM domain-containing protein